MVKEYDKNSEVTVRSHIIDWTQETHNVDNAGSH